VHSLPSFTYFPYTTLFRSWSWATSTPSADSGSKARGSRAVLAGHADGRASPPPSAPYTPNALARASRVALVSVLARARTSKLPRSEEHTSELQSREKLVCR